MVCWNPISVCCIRVHIAQGQVLSQRRIGSQGSHLKVVVAVEAVAAIIAVMTRTATAAVQMRGVLRCKCPSLAHAILARSVICCARLMLRVVVRMSVAILCVSAAYRHRHWNDGGLPRGMKRFPWDLIHIIG